MRLKITEGPRLGALLLFLAYLATIPAANWAITEYGAVPVGFGLLAPAGVYFAGAVFALRDWLREAASRAVTLWAIGAGTALSFTVADAKLAAASAVAFLVSEVLDFAVYEPLRERRLLPAVFVSNAVGLTADSMLFLWLAFGSWEFLPGQVVGKAWITAAALPLIVAVRYVRRRQHAEA